MQVTLPVTHKVKARRKRHKDAHEWVVFRDAVFDLAVTDPDDCPVAARGLSRPEGHVRWDGSAFWTPDLRSGVRQDEAAGPEQWSAAARTLPCPESLRSHLVKHGFNTPAGKPCDPDEFRDVVHSWFEARHADLSAFLAGNVRVIAGAVYRSCLEPVLSVSGSLTECDVSFGTERRDGYRSWYALTRRDDVAEAVAAAGGDAEAVPRPEILMPEAFAVRDEVMSLHAAVRCFLDHDSHLSRLTDEAGIAWFTMRTAAREFAATLDDSDGDRLADRIEEFLALQEEGPGIYFEHHLPGLERALARWKDRPMELDGNWRMT